MAKRLLVFLALLMFGFMIAGCSEGDDSNTVVNPNPDPLTPVGSISGVVWDWCDNVGVEGAIVSVAYAGGVRKVTTDASGTFSFNDVPANLVYEGMYPFDDGYYFPGYLVVCELPAAYGYDLVEEVWIAYSELYDGTNVYVYEEGFEESGSGASTPVHKLASSLYFDVGAANASISGVVLDATTVATTPLAQAAVNLYICGDFFATTTTDATGAFSFTGLYPFADYELQVVQPGYRYTTSIGTDSPDDCGLLDVDCVPGCNQDVGGIVLWFWADPLADVTAPYIVQIDADAETDLIDDDEIDFQVEEFVVTFSEAMATNRTTKNAVDLEAYFYVLVTSSGCSTEQGGINVLDDYTVTWDTTGTEMTVTPIYKSEDDILAALGASDWVDSDDLTFEIYAIGSYYTLSFDEGNYHLTDANYVPWYIDEDEANDDGFLYAPGAWYQEIILEGWDDIDLSVAVDTELAF
ncbi:MAG: carboxypeptidase-like regulatory domain-containing protein [Desulfomonilia bacterium]